MSTLSVRATRVLCAFALITAFAGCSHERHASVVPAATKQQGTPVNSGASRRPRSCHTDAQGVAWHDNPDGTESEVDLCIVIPSTVAVIDVGTGTSCNYQCGIVTLSNTPAFQIYQNAIARQCNDGPNGAWNSKSAGAATADGKLGCAWQVNEVIKAAVGHTVGALTNSVPSFVKACNAGLQGCNQIPPEAAGAGDIAVQDGNDPNNGQNHMGVCLNAGCSSVLSNNSSGTHKGQMCWQSGPTFSPTYSNGKQPTFYRITG